VVLLSHLLIGSKVRTHASVAVPRVPVNVFAQLQVGVTSINCRSKAVRHEWHTTVQLRPVKRHKHAAGLKA